MDKRSTAWCWVIPTDQLSRKATDKLWSPLWEERALQTGASVETSNGMMISEVLIPHLFKIAHEFGEVAVAAAPDPWKWSLPAPRSFWRWWRWWTARAARSRSSATERSRRCWSVECWPCLRSSLSAEFACGHLRVFREKATAALQLSHRVTGARGPLHSVRGDAVRQHHGPDRWPMDFWQVLL